LSGDYYERGERERDRTNYGIALQANISSRTDLGVAVVVVNVKLGIISSGYASPSVNNLPRHKPSPPFYSPITVAPFNENVNAFGMVRSLSLYYTTTTTNTYQSLSMQIGTESEGGV
jgi:hypothetical protein